MSGFGVNTFWQGVCRPTSVSLPTREILFPRSDTVLFVLADSMYDAKAVLAIVSGMGFSARLWDMRPLAKGKWKKEYRYSTKKYFQKWINRGWDCLMSIDPIDRNDLSRFMKLFGLKHPLLQSFTLNLALGVASGLKNFVVLLDTDNFAHMESLAHLAYTFTYKFQHMHMLHWSAEPVPVLQASSIAGEVWKVLSTPRATRMQRLRCRLPEPQIYKARVSKKWR